MPKATINKNCYFFVCENNIWTPRQAILESIPQPSLPESSSQQQLNISTLMPYTPHQLAALLFREHISQL